MKTIGKLAGALRNEFHGDILRVGLAARAQVETIFAIATRSLDADD